jgi:cbb3-type cytochrome oxidase maturation protein
MVVIIVLLTISLLVSIFFLLAYLWSVKAGQFDDDYAPAHRIFFDDKTEQSKTKTKK